MINISPQGLEINACRVVSSMTGVLHGKPSVAFQYLLLFAVNLDVTVAAILLVYRGFLARMVYLKHDI